MTRTTHRRPLLAALVICVTGAYAAAGCGSDGDTAASSPGSSSASSSGDGDSPVDAGPAKTYSIGATVVGLKGSGFVLQDMSGALINVAANGGTSQKVSFPVKVPTGTVFDVSVKTQPSTPTQLCEVTGGKGSVVAADVDSITVNCTDQYTVGGTVTGLAGKDLVLENNGAADTVTVNANGTFAFPKPLAPGASYAVTIKTNPTDLWQTCAFVADGGGAATGTVGNANITDIAINCTTNKYTLGVKLTGLVATGTGVTFKNNAADDLAFAADGTKTFAMAVTSGTNFDITVATSPTTPWQTCTVPAAGKAKMLGANTTIDVTCVANTYKVGGTLSGLQGNGLVLQNNAGDDLPLNGAAANGAFSFLTKVASGMPYAVSVKTQPNTVLGETCVATLASGTVAGVDVTTVKVECASDKKVFLTSLAYPASTLGGLVGADTKCQERATAAGLPGTYKAWLSDSTGSPSTRFTRSAVPYVRTDGNFIANNWADLVDNTWANPINKTESGAAAPNNATGLCEGPTSVLTNTTGSGQRWGDYSCGDWASGANSSGAAVNVNTSTSPGSLCALNNSCAAGAAPLYCFQQ
jgi:hypothetical protein